MTLTPETRSIPQMSGIISIMKGMRITRLNVFLKFFRGDNSMEEKINLAAENSDTSLMPAPIAEVAAECRTLRRLPLKLKCTFTLRIKV